MRTLKIFLTLALFALTLSVRADDKALFIELPAGALPRDISSSGMVVGELRSGGGFYWLPTTGVVYIGGQVGRCGEPRRRHDCRHGT